MKKIAIIILALVIAKSCLSQRKTTMLACFGSSSGIGAAAIFHTPEGPGAYAEYFRYGSSIGTMQNFGFGISIPTAHESLTIGAGLGMYAMDVDLAGKSYGETINGHAAFYVKKLALKAGFIMSPRTGQASGNVGIGISL